MKKYIISSSNFMDKIIKLQLSVYIILLIVNYNWIVLSRLDIGYKGLYNWCLTITNIEYSNFITYYKI